MKVSILTIGDEICIGQVLNTNSVWIADKMTQLGCEVLAHSVVGDNKESILAETERLMKSSDVVITTGGLGPTHDDITKITLCEFFNDKLTLNDEVLKHIADLFATRGFKMLESNKMQSMVPSRCKVLKNELGTAPGMIFEKSGKYLISLPGVPQEMKMIAKNHLIPFILEQINLRKSDIISYRNIMFTGIPESHLAELLGETSAFLSEKSTLAFLPSYNGLKLRIGFIALSFSEAEQEFDKIISYITQKAGQYIYAYGEISLSEAIGKILKEKKRTLAVAESCTGGMLAADFTNTPGSSDYFHGGVIAYDNSVKEKILGVEPDIIARYGTVSLETVKAMAEGIRKLFRTDFGIAITGIAGPTGGTEEKPVGTIWIAVADEKSIESKKYIISSDRQVNRERAVGTALNLLLNRLRKS